MSILLIIILFTLKQAHKYSNPQMMPVNTKSDLLNELTIRRSNAPQYKTALVPTMGYLHDGHINLIQEAKKLCENVIVSIFVNPLQFNETSDFENYPANAKRDLEICEAHGVSMVFMPSSDEMYSHKPLLKMEMPSLTKNLCGKHRPGHFEGVLMVVARLFQLCQPDIAIFGKKDYQQYLVIKQMAEDLEFKTRVVGIETYRDKNGLALSSRNARLSERGLEHAGLISRALNIGKKEFLDGTTGPGELREIMKDIIESGSLNKIEYLDIVDSKDLEIKSSLASNSAFLIATAVFVEGIRLIDNIEVNF